MPDKIINQKSELETLLEKNAYTNKGLTSEEVKIASQLIEVPEYSKENCWVCEMNQRIAKNPEPVDKAIYDTGLCRGHARYALATRK